MDKVLGHYWKPDKADIVPLFKKPKRRKPKKKKFDYNQAREFVIRHYGLHKYASYAAISFVIHKKTDIKLAEQKSGYKKMIRHEYNRLTGKTKEKRQRKTKSDKQFYSSQSWKEVRYIVLAKFNGTCVLCGAKASDGISIHVDHIEPRSISPKKELDINNLQALCEDCNLGKSNFDDTDWRQHWKTL